MDDSRNKHKPVQNATPHIAYVRPQPPHGSPYHVHPYPSPVRLQHAFQSQSPSMFQPRSTYLSMRPHLEPRSLATYGTPQPSPILGRALCFTRSPAPSRVSHLNERFQDSMTINADTDALVAKISAMFPTVSDTHIKILLKKYFNREAVVISALQVEKHPITTPGPAMSPSSARVQNSTTGPYAPLQLTRGNAGSMHGSSHFTPLSVTPQESPLLLRPASGASSSYYKSLDIQATKHSPMLKLKYLKSIFPKVDETVLLDALINNDNNVNKASEELITLGFTKKEPAPKNETVPRNEPPPEQPPPRKVNITTNPEEDKELCQKLAEAYPGVPENIIATALDSVACKRELTEHLLNSVRREAETPKIKPPEVKEPKRYTVVESLPGPVDVRPLSPPPPPRRPKTWAIPKPILKTSNGVETRYKSQYSTPNVGPNPSLRQGPQDNLLLPDYLPWTGPNPDLRAYNCVRPQGPQVQPRSTRLARGPSEQAQGPAGLARGSIYQKGNKKTAKMCLSKLSRLQLRTWPHLFTARCKQQKVDEHTNPAAGS